MLSISKQNNADTFTMLKEVQSLRQILQVIWLSPIRAFPVEDNRVPQTVMAKLYSIIVLREAGPVSNTYNTWASICVLNNVFDDIVAEHVLIFINNLCLLVYCEDLVGN